MILENTPLMKQYGAIKESYPGHIVFFRLGDFYEMFGEDAKIAAPILQITLTTRDKNKDDPIAMCGVPYFSADIYINKLIKAGYKVAICEQVEDPKTAKGIVQREVVRVITPGTFAADNPRENNYILCFYLKDGIYGAAAADLSTGEFTLFETSNPVEDEIARYEPKEILFPASTKGSINNTEFAPNVYVTFYEDWHFEYIDCYRALLNYFNVASLEGYGCEGMERAISAGGALLCYLQETLTTLPFNRINVLRQNSYMFLDAATKKNLELTHNLKDSSEKGTLLWVLDQTQTPMGARFLRSALTKPLISSVEINKRLKSVNSLIEDYDILEELRSTFRHLQDVERLTSKTLAGTAMPRDLLGLKASVSMIPKIKKALVQSSNSYIASLGKELSDFNELSNLIGIAITDNPPNNLREGGIIKKGYNSEVDELRDISSNAKQYIAALEQEERLKTGISSLKIGYNKVFGYYIEVTNPNLQFVPPDYIRKQTLSNCERFITPDLKDYESKVTSAEDKLRSIEYELYLALLEKIKKYSKELFNASSAIAIIDFLASLATVAKRNNYVMPEVNDSELIEITEGRHPVIEKMIRDKIINDSDTTFIPNDVSIDKEDHMLLIITGPNMAGKSTYMRQTALITLMAQIGSFVPASKAVIGIVDRIFTRIGASDYISRGQSTFMVEMIETANILNNATEKSLIILDEIGRGTSTFDGISIAWAVAEHLVGAIKARTLFATHYNELTDIQKTMEGVQNYNVIVREWGDSIVFLRRVEKGSADKSYGIQVARLAGLPQRVIERAREVLSELEKKEAERIRYRSIQLDLFSCGDPIKDEIMNLRLDKLSPQKALAKLKELQEKILLC